RVARERVEVDLPRGDDGHPVVQRALDALPELAPGAGVGRIVLLVPREPALARRPPAAARADRVGQPRVDHLAGLGILEARLEVPRADDAIARLARDVRAVESLVDLRAEDAIDLPAHLRGEAPRLVELLADDGAITPLRRIAEDAALQRRVDLVERRGLRVRHLRVGLARDEVRLHHEAVAGDEVHGRAPRAARRDLVAGAAVRDLLEPVPVREPRLRGVRLLAGGLLVERLVPARRRVEPAVADRLALDLRVIDLGDVVGRRPDV